MKKLLWIFFVGMLTAASTVTAQDQVVLSNGEWAPYLSKSLPEYGAASHIVKLAFAAAGVETKYEFYPWKRSYKLAREGKVNGTPVWVYTKERAADFYYTDIVITDFEYLFHLKSKPLNWKTVSDLNGRIIGATLHTVYPTLEAAAEKGTLIIERAGNYDKLYLRLLSHRIDAIPQVSQVGKYYLRTSLTPAQQEEITYSTTVLQKRQYHLILSRKVKTSPELVRLFNQGLAMIMENGMYQKVFDDLENGKYDPKNE